MLREWLDSLFKDSKPCGCSKEVGGEPWKKRFNSELVPARRCRIRYDYVETVRECAECGEMNLVRQVWHSRSPHPIWHNWTELTDDGEEVRDPEYTKSFSWCEPGHIDTIARWDRCDRPDEVEYLSWE